MKDLRDTIKQINKDRDLSQESVATNVGISQSYFSSIINKNKKLDYELIIKLSNFYKLSILDMLTYPEKYIKEDKFKLELKEAQASYGRNVELEKAREEIAILKALLADKERLIDKLISLPKK